MNVNTPNVDYSNELEINITTIGSWGPRNPPGVEEDSENKISYLAILHKEKVSKKIIQSVILIHSKKIKFLSHLLSQLFH